MESLNSVYLGYGLATMVFIIWLVYNFTSLGDKKKSRKSHGFTAKRDDVGNVISEHVRRPQPTPEPDPCEPPHFMRRLINGSDNILPPGKKSAGRTNE